MFGAANLRAFVNTHASLKLGPWFDVLLKFVIPAILATVIVWNLYIDLVGGPLYGSGFPLGAVDWFPVVIPLVWIVGTLAVAAFFTSRETAPEAAEPVLAPFEG